MISVFNQDLSENPRCRCLYSTAFVEEADIARKRVLDTGSGFGWFERYAVSKGVRAVCGLELSEANVEIARKNVPDKKVAFKCGSALELPYKGGSFDTVVAWEVVEHVPKGMEEAMFKEVYRVLKPGGIFYLSTPAKAVLSQVLDPAWWLAGHRHYAVAQIESLARATHFSMEKTAVRGGPWYLVWLLNIYISKWLFRRGPLMEKWFVKYVNREFMATSGFTNVFVRLKKV